MKKTQIIVFFLIFSVSIALAGCVPLIVGGTVGAVGGYAVSKDTIQGDTDKPYDSLWRSAEELAKMRGSVKEEDYVKGSIEFTAGPAHVWIKLLRMTQSTTRLKVSARKRHLPNLTLAEEIFTKIMDGAR